MRKFALLLSLILFLSGFVSAQIIELKGISCPGESTGILGVFPDFGTGPYTYAWNTGETDNTIEGLIAGTYTVTVTDALLVSQVFNYDLVDPLPLTAAYAIVPNSNWPAPNGRITITPSGGSGWMTYQIIDSTTTKKTTQISNIFNNLYSGTYFVRIIDLYGCERFDTVVVGELSGITTSFDIDYTACYRSTAPISDVRPVLVPANLPAEVQFPEDTVIIIELLSGSRYRTSVNDTVTSFSSGVYPGRNIFKVVTNDNKGFRYTWSVDSVITPIKITWTQDTISCFGDNTGRINALAEGSYGVFDYTITGPSGFSSNNASVSNLFAGRYTIHVEDSAQCARDQSVIIKQPDAPIHGTLSKKDLTCFNSNDGTITANFIGGTGQIDYSWSSGQTTGSLNNLSAGNYILSMTDANGCTPTPLSVVVSQPARLRVTSVVVPLNCFGYANASITTNVVGGNGGNDFTWKKDGVLMNYNNNAINNLSAGLYSLHLEDSLNCSFDTTWTIVQPTKLRFKFVNTYITCNDDLGTIRVHNLEAFPLNVTVGGITQNVLFDDTTSFANLPVGNHLVSISNATCSFDTIIIFTQNLPLVLNVSTVNNLCFDDQNGSVEVNVSGGSSGPNCTFLLDGTDYTGTAVSIAINVLSNSFLVQNLKAGNYTIHVEDSTGCMREQSVLITQPDAEIQGTLTPKNLTCFQSQDGSIRGNFFGGSGQLNYSWSSGQITESIYNLDTGTYVLEITDGNGCVFIPDSIVIIQPEELSINGIMTSINCYGYDNARILTSAIGGTSPYIYEWERNNSIMDTNQDSIFNLSPGTYSLQITDSLGCKFNRSWTILEPNNFQFEFVNTPVVCNDDLGTIRVRNLEVFNLDVTVGGTTESGVFNDTLGFGDLPAGDHLVRMTDGVCTFDTTIIFTQSLPLVLNISTTNNLCYDGQVGIIDVEVNGGTAGPNSTFSLDGTDYLGTNIVGVGTILPSNSFLVDQLKAGSYNLVVTDDNGCISRQTVNVTQPVEALRAHFESQTTFCHESEDGMIRIDHTENSLAPLTYLWNNGRNTEQIDSLVTGIYYVTITDANGCTATDSAEVLAGEEVCIPNTVTPNDDGLNDVFEITNLCYYSDVYVSIMDQSRVVLFETNDCSTSWDGKDKNGNLISSNPNSKTIIVFAYIRQIKDDGNVRIFHKTVTVMY